MNQANLFEPTEITPYKLYRDCAVEAKSVSDFLNLKRSKQKIPHEPFFLPGKDSVFAQWITCEWLGFSSSGEELAHWLVNNKANAGAGIMTATYEQWLRVCLGGYAATFYFDGGNLLPGVAANFKSHLAGLARHERR